MPFSGGMFITRELLDAGVLAIGDGYRAKIDPVFLFYWMQDDEFREQFDSVKGRVLSVSLLDGDRVGGRRWRVPGVDADVVPVRQSPGAIFGKRA